MAETEPFYAGVLTDIGAISKGHRNPTLHEFERTYDERETRYMITVVSGFTIHVGRQLPDADMPETQQNA